MRVIAMLIFCSLLAIFPCYGQSDRALLRRVIKTSIEARTFFQHLGEISSKNNVLVAVEALASNEPASCRTAFRLASNETLEISLDALMVQCSVYQWREHDGIIVVAPIQRDSNSVMEVIVDGLAISNRTIDECVSELFDSVGVRTWQEKNNVQFDSTKAYPGPAKDPTTYSFLFDNQTLRQALHKLVKNTKSKFFVVYFLTEDRKHIAVNIF